MHHLLSSVNIRPLFSDKVITISPEMMSCTDIILTSELPVLAIIYTLLPHRHFAWFDKKYIADVTSPQIAWHTLAALLTLCCYDECRNLLVSYYLHHLILF